MSKIIFLANIFVPERGLDAWADSYTREGYQIEFWEIGPIFGLTKFVDYNHNYIFRRVWTLKQLYMLILKQKIRSTVFLFFGTEEIFNYSHALIRILGGKYCIVDFFSANLSKREILLEKKLKETKRHWMDLFLPAYSFLGSRHSVYTIKSDYQWKKGRNVFVHIGDYDEYLKKKDKDAPKEIAALKPYILLLDQNFFDHPDQVNFCRGQKWIRDEDTFIEEMHDFLDEVEKQFSMKVVIASHPMRAARIEELYQGRQIVSGNTCEYTKNAEYIIVCCSGAISYAVMFKKRILMYTSDVIKRSIFYLQYQLPKARCLKAGIVNISKDMRKYALEDYLTDNSDYADYLEYLTDDAESEELLKDTVLRYLKTL